MIREPDWKPMHTLIEETLERVWDALVPLVESVESIAAEAPTPEPTVVEVNGKRWRIGDRGRLESYRSSHGWVCRADDTIVTAVRELVLAELRGRPMSELPDNHNERVRILHDDGRVTGWCRRTFREDDAFNGRMCWWPEDGWQWLAALLTPEQRQV
jgi:hypothetical protein